ncbi:uncharacterized protein N7479_009684, partial [Penicillium vulpinum]|uniref:uncharacterized protein n=1 Tax=Penicillium vulpinum TaxID=29845 RepID=UPI0025481D15
EGDDWKSSEAYPDDFLTTHEPEDLAPVSKNTRVCVIIASASKIRTCDRCRQALIRHFRMRESWWSDHYKRSNGYFGCETTRHAGMVTGINTWAYFEVKQLFKNRNYEWNSLNVFTRWVALTKQTFVLIFDPNFPVEKEIMKGVLNLNLSLLDDPYWVYPILLDRVAHLQESAVWLIRHQVRVIEKRIDVTPENASSQYFRELHDIARHAIHVNETLDVAVQSIESIQMHHANLVASTTYDPDPTVGQDLRAELEFFRVFIANLRHRSISNDKRLQNEIQSAFGITAKRNAETSVEIGRAARMDSAAMKTIALVTLIFLPPTFISSVFSMSFFHIDDNNAWGLSNEFWVYWVFAVPITVVTVIVWQRWQHWHNSTLGPGYMKPDSGGNSLDGSKLATLKLVDENRV